MHNLYCNIYKYYPNYVLGDLFCLECKQRKKVYFYYHLSKHLVICIFLWEIKLGIIQGANLYYVTDFVCIMCKIVNWGHTNIFK